MFTRRSPLLALALCLGISLGAVLMQAPASAKSAKKTTIRVTIKGLNHHPVVNRKWTYSVTVTTSTGKRPSGTETTHYLYNGAVVGTEKPINVPFRNGYYHDTIEFPSAAVGHPLSVWAVVKTKYGSGSAAWWVVVVTR